MHNTLNNGVIDASLDVKQPNKLGRVLVSGVGFLADAYDLFVIDFVLAILVATSKVQPTIGEKGIVASATLAGAVVGQLGFGVAADFIGRRVMFMLTSILCTAGSILSAVVGFGYDTSPKQSFSIFYQLALCRFFLGIGIGGEYPLAATVASETESETELINIEMGKQEIACPEQSGRTDIWWFLSQQPNSIAAVFSMQGVGMLLSPLLVMFLIAVKMPLTAIWRVCLFVGAIPSSIAFIFRWKMQETAAFTRTRKYLADAKDPTFPTLPDSEEDVPSRGMMMIQKKNRSSRRTCRDFGRHLVRTGMILKRFAWVLFATSSTWFLIDVTLYGTGSFKSEVVGQWFEPSPTSSGGSMLGEGLHMEKTSMKRPFEFGGYFPPPTGQKNFNEADERVKLMRKARMGSIIACIAIPGYALTLFLVHKTGIKLLQFWGFIAVGLVFIALGIEQIAGGKIVALELILFGLTFLFSNFGPNATTFISPTQIYPTVVRATCHGFSAAMGKLGGVVGTSLFSLIQEQLGLGWLLIICGLVALVGAACTLLLPSDARSKELLRSVSIVATKRSSLVEIV